MKHFLAAIIVAACAALAQAQTEADLQGANPPANGLWIDALDLSRVQQDWGERARRPIGGQSPHRPARGRLPSRRRNPRDQRVAHRPERVGRAVPGGRRRR